MSPSGISGSIWKDGFGGFIASLGFYGVSLAQTIFYYRTFPDDRRSYRVLVMTLFVLDTLHVCIVSHFFWLALIVRRFYGSTIILDWHIPATIYITAFMTFLVQGFYCYRIWIFSERNWFLSCTIALLAAIQLTSGIAFSTEFVLNDPEVSVFALGELQLFSTLACDVIITSAMIFYLYSNRTGLKRTEAVLEKIILFTVSTGLIGSLLLLSIAVLTNSPDANYFRTTAPQFIIGKCYVNSLLAILNVREKLRKMLENVDPFSLPTIRMNGSRLSISIENP